MGKSLELLTLMSLTYFPIYNIHIRDIKVKSSRDFPI